MGLQYSNSSAVNSSMHIHCFTLNAQPNITGASIAAGFNMSNETNTTQGTIVAGIGLQVGESQARSLMLCKPCQ